jgi:hypothetical protein
LKNIAHADVGFMINSKTTGKKGNCKGVAEYVDVKFDLFVCLALKQAPQKSQLKNQSTPLTLLFLLMSLISFRGIILLKSLIIKLCHHLKT